MRRAAKTLVSAIRAVARRSPIPVRVHDHGVGRQPEAIESAIYFCARQAIRNAVKHAGAGACVTVTLAMRDDAVDLTVTDNGVGMTLGATADGSGILDMRDRIEAIAGAFKIASEPGRGTSVRATVPTRIRTRT